MNIFSSHPNVHVIGIGGAGMSGVARLLLEMGCSVSGSDATESPVLHELQKAGITVTIGHNENALANAMVVLWSPAIKENNVEFAGAKQRGLTMLSRSELLRELAELVPVLGLTDRRAHV